ncbi:hypothetical protein AJ85_14390 [Alkalihalobacillus alcalophilus ATCC 27647 = CGMCC 1.3604]|uniref:DUF4367 domain-containing protein n=1 Tax=Alkalihalobacillus alcalophilus ATCC 27647 = CGMCC 1.3604 TaxID=1218173 RepID=A0A094XHP5_ALKAL|nr:hypothetical protein [Alkalihalobacillus alcalophilus]KGA98280.1 hypothetical protein BALCAV_0205045 [Alkalihalobacillus alcalophilus ATCC 27647 = CGMCC 1.3604]MED1561598.1 hypothetical protein [Alkalihalobacillus alcalophilus]THG89949.1 hypothetical protein AJ85_14390 [Alkalihalobacillus alcalophilus ATCC 27647 = CGMCC 1.3604]
MLRILLVSFLLFTSINSNHSADNLIDYYKETDFKTIEEAIKDFEQQKQLSLVPPNYIPFKVSHSFGRYIEKGTYKGQLHLEYIDQPSNNVISIFVSDASQEFAPTKDGSEEIINNKILTKYNVVQNEEANISNLSFKLNDKAFLIQFITNKTNEPIEKEKMFKIFESIIDNN